MKGPGPACGPVRRRPALGWRVVDRIVRKFRTLEEAERADREDYRRMSPDQRLEILLHLLADPWPQGDAPPEGLQRVYRVAQLKRG